MAFNTDGTRLYVTNQNSNTVSVINTATNTVTATIAVGRQPNHITIIGTRAYISVAQDNKIQILDTTTNTLTATITANSPFGSTASPDGTSLYVANGSTNTISVINTATNTVSGTIATGTTLPYKVAITPDGTRLFVTSIGSWSTPAGAVTVIDTTTNTTIANLPNNTWSFGRSRRPQRQLHLPHQPQHQHRHRCGYDLGREAVIPRATCRPRPSPAGSLRAA